VLGNRVYSVGDLVQRVVDRATKEDESPDRHDGDEGEEQGILDEAGACVVLGGKVACALQPTSMACRSFTWFNIREIS